LRNELSTLLASYFILHLREELKKSKSLVEAITKEGMSFQDFTKNFLKTVQLEFPEAILIKTKLNLFKEWHEKRHNLKSYEDTTFKMFSQVFYSRLLDFKYGTIEKRSIMKEHINLLLGVGKSYGRDFTFRLLFERENAMKESLRDLLLLHSEIDFQSAWDLIYEQNEFYTETAYIHFDSILKDSLKRSDDLLLNILPEEIAAELKANGKTNPKFYKSASVIFTDFKGFTQIAESLSPTELVNELDNSFSQFDKIISENHLEKIKTIGDAYMCVGGIPLENETHPIDSCLAALQILDSMNQVAESKKKSGIPFWEIRIGIHTGSLIAGVIGSRKFAYDVWGDTVNTASRLESSGTAGRINTSETTYELAKKYFEFEERGKISAKNKGEIHMYYLNRILPEYSKDEKGIFPNEVFIKEINNVAD
jgi:class 3 adenylate cyclase